MHAAKSCWAGQVFATASNNDSAGKKSRIRKSKEERKSMVESFINKYQKSNNGNFPSLNLTHKEVGGSFYTVREIVREIIQENRVLAPPKLSLEENGHSGFLEQHPLGSISIEPQIDLSASDIIHMATHTMPNSYQITSEEYISKSSVQYNGSYNMEVNDEEIIKEVGQDVVTNVDHQENSDVILQYEQSHKENGQIVDKINEFGQRIYRESEVAVEILDREKYGAEELETSQAIDSHVKSDVVVETFPLRPVLQTILTMDEKSGNLHETAGTLEKGEEKLLESTVESNGEYKNEKVVINLQLTSLESLNDQSGSKVNVLNIADNADLESKNSLPDGTKASSSKDCLISENSSTLGRKSSDQENSNLPKGKNPMLDRINLETWEGTSRKATRPENNPLLALVKAFITSFVKFWTE
ncbi:hypothetical protein ABFS82_06G181700 [Erythranthe guttata]|uniref:uncharacterized protein LOC105955589 n=1 Tax=Erythranthe guttata TaxID=4155 RepID=UPI00064DBAF5|nr:PREDICTED: uncharacterized protein LOC105955589 [Erythranthe guttata]|eukprot:XP_012834795.1 PREDICTED: uncharacterized protein LOC105955589 [Erythranthe guttata]